MAPSKLGDGVTKWDEWGRTGVEPVSKTAPALNRKEGERGDVTPSLLGALSPAPLPGRSVVMLLDCEASV